MLKGLENYIAVDSLITVGVIVILWKRILCSTIDEKLSLDEDIVIVFEIDEDHYRAGRPGALPARGYFWGDISAERAHALTLFDMAFLQILSLRCLQLSERYCDKRYNSQKLINLPAVST